MHDDTQIFTKYILIKFIYLYFEGCSQRQKKKTRKAENIELYTRKRGKRVSLPNIGAFITEVLNCFEIQPNV